MLSQIQLEAELKLFSFDSDEMLTPCQVEHRQTMRNFGYNKFIPLCKPDGRYEEVQCGRGWLHCWCVNISGRELSGTRTTGFPKCSK